MLILYDVISWASHLQTLHITESKKSCPYTKNHEGDKDQLYGTARRCYLVSFS
jgi:hypothetical protein